MDIISLLSTGKYSNTIAFEGTQPQEGVNLWCPISAIYWQTVLDLVRTGCS